MPGEARAETARLYSPRLLALATGLAAYPLTDETFPHRAEVRSRSCGSTLMLGVATDADGRVNGIGMQVAACAIGQGSAAIMADAAIGRTHADFAAILAAIDAWLAGEGALPDWPGFDALEAARAHPGRHEALRLPWKAMLAVLSSAAVPR